MRYKTKKNHTVYVTHLSRVNIRYTLTIFFLPHLEMALDFVQLYWHISTYRQAQTLDLCILIQQETFMNTSQAQLH